jgi:hypothetical protein
VIRLFYDPPAPGSGLREISVPSPLAVAANLRVADVTRRGVLSLPRSPNHLENALRRDELSDPAAAARSRSAKARCSATAFPKWNVTVPVFGFGVTCRTVEGNLDLQIVREVGHPVMVQTRPP